LNPHSSLAYERVAETYEGLSDWAQAKAVLEAAVAAGRDSMSVHEHLFELALIDGDAPGMARQVSFAAGRIDEDEMLQGQADAAAFQGKLAASRELRLKAARAVEREGLHESAAIIYSDQAVIESLCGERQRTLEQVARVPSSAQTTLALVNAAEALANIGEVQRAEQIRPAVPLGGWLQPGVTVTDAMLQIQRGDASGALATLEKSAIVDLGRYTALRPPFVRGLAYLALKDGAKAAAEFQKIRDHRGISPVSILYPLAHLQQARAYALIGEVESARRTYESFFSIWQHADENVSVLQHARREYAALSERHASEEVARIKPATRR
jgi:tetratricopeptide (TPR) repeat protein